MSDICLLWYKVCVRKADKPLFIIGLLFILFGLGWSGVSQITSKFQPTPTPTVVVPTKPASSPTPVSSSAVLGDVSRTQAQVTDVVDGDTIHVQIGDKKETVRLIGVDTPETVDPRKSVQCFGKQASDFTKQQLSNKTVFLEKDDSQGDRDKYQRLLAYISLEDGINFNKLLIQEGYAHEYTYHLPYRYQSEFKQVELEARENNRGLWDVCYTQ